MATTSIVEPGAPNDLPKIEEGDSSSDQQFPPSPARVRHFSRAFLLGPVKPKHADLPLLACCLCTGMTDAACFANWSTFVGMQTGRLSPTLVSNRNAKQHAAGAKLIAGSNII